MKIYILLKKSILTKNQKVLLQDVAQVSCSEAAIRSKINKLELCDFDKNQIDRKIISIIYIIDMINKYLARMKISEPDIICMGEEDVIIEYDCQHKSSGLEIVKIIFVSIIIFFGSAFAIMSFHEDIGLESMFERVCGMLGMNRAIDVKIFSITYSIGLAIGILIFYKQLTRKKIKEPSPLEMEMQEYEDKLDETIISEEGKNENN